MEREDKETAAIAVVVKAIEDLTLAQRYRVLAHVGDRDGIGVFSPDQVRSPSARIEEQKTSQ